MSSSLFPDSIWSNSLLSQRLTELEKLIQGQLNTNNTATADGDLDLSASFAFDAGAAAASHPVAVPGSPSVAAFPASFLSASFSASSRPPPEILDSLTRLKDLLLVYLKENVHQREKQLLRYKEMLNEEKSAAFKRIQNIKTEHANEIDERERKWRSDFESSVVKKDGEIRALQLELDRINSAWSQKFSRKAEEMEEEKRRIRAELEQMLNDRLAAAESKVQKRNDDKLRSLTLAYDKEIEELQCELKRMSEKLSWKQLEVAESLEFYGKKERDLRSEMEEEMKRKEEKVMELMRNREENANQLAKSLREQLNSVRNEGFMLRDQVVILKQEIASQRAENGEIKEFLRVEKKKSEYLEAELEKAKDLEESRFQLRGMRVEMDRMIREKEEEMKAAVEGVRIEWELDKKKWEEKREEERKKELENTEKRIQERIRVIQELHDAEMRKLQLDKRGWMDSIGDLETKIKEKSDRISQLEEEREKVKLDCEMEYRVQAAQYQERLREKIEGIKLQYLRREEFLCKACRQRSGAVLKTSFMRLCQDIIRPAVLAGRGPVAALPINGIQSPSSAYFHAAAAAEASKREAAAAFPHAVQEFEDFKMSNDAAISDADVELQSEEIHEFEADEKIPAQPEPLNSDSEAKQPRVAFAASNDIAVTPSMAVHDTIQVGRDGSLRLKIAGQPSNSLPQMPNSQSASVSQPSVVTNMSPLSYAPQPVHSAAVSIPSYLLSRPSDQSTLVIPPPQFSAPAPLASGPSTSVASPSAPFQQPSRPQPDLSYLQLAAMASMAARAPAAGSSLSGSVPSASPVSSPSPAIPSIPTTSPATLTVSRPQKQSSTGVGSTRPPPAALANLKAKAARNAISSSQVQPSKPSSKPAAALSAKPSSAPTSASASTPAGSAASGSSAAAGRSLYAEMLDQYLNQKKKPAKSQPAAASSAS